MRNFFILFSACFLFFSCTKEPVGIDKAPEPLTKSGDVMASMQELAAALPAMFNDDQTTKSTYSAAVTDITPLADILWSISERSATKSSGVMALSNTVSTDPDTAAVRDIYVVNYEDGFAILSNIPQSPSILAYAPQGSLTADTDPDPGLAIILENIPVYTRAVIDSLFDNRYEKRYVKRPDLTTVTKYGQLTTTQWNQSAPFNNKMGYGGCSSLGSAYNGRYPAGCVAVAMAQLMVFHGHPAVVGGVTHNWVQYRNYKTAQNIPTNAADNVATLLYDIGQKVGMQYACSGSGSNIYAAQSAFVSFYGYASDLVSNYNFSTVQSSINAGRPVYFRGDDKAYGHAWIADGYEKENYYEEEWVYTYDAANNLIDTEYRGIVSGGTGYLLHFNLGWGGQNDGYYLSNLVDDTRYRYRYNLKIIPNIRKASVNNHITITGNVPNYTISASSPVASNLTIGCMAVDTLTEMRYTLPAGQSSINITSDYTLSRVTSVYPTSDATYRYTY